MEFDTQRCSPVRSRGLVDLQNFVLVLLRANLGSPTVPQRKRRAGADAGTGAMP